MEDFSSLSVSTWNSSSASRGVELDAGGVADSASLFADGDAKFDQQMGLAGAGVAQQHDRVAGVEVAAGGESGDRGRGDGGATSATAHALPRSSMDSSRLRRFV
jgi:hypothetical protein